MSEAAILALLQAVPAIMQTFATLQANGQIKDQATLDAALKAQQAAAETDIAKLLSDLG